MLLSLHVQNFAIIDNINIDFKDHMTVLTGETGAGKSLIIDAIGLLFGSRSSSTLVRFGEEKAIIEGIFSSIPLEIQEFTNSTEDDVLIIRREIYSNGKSVVKINNKTTTLSQLIQFSELIGDIHTQFDTQRLFNPKHYLSFIDDETISNLLNDYKENLKQYNLINKEYKKLINKSDDNIQKLEFFKYQIKELELANLSLDEEEELKLKSKYAENFENIVNNLKEVETLFNDEKTLDNIYLSIANLAKLESIDEKYLKFKSRIEDSYYNLVDTLDDLTKEYKSLDFNEAELESINDRLGVYSDLKRKYKKTTSEIIDYYQEITNEVNNIENYDFIIGKLEKELENSYKKTLNSALLIRKQRLILANELEKNILLNLKDLKLEKTKFEIEFNNIENPSFKNDGIDEIDFLISFNIGEPLKPLSKVVSGGESSRFMLALKALVSDKLNLQTIIFDEIDNGVSGEIAYSIANKIKSIAKKSQVLCVTHLPQVAAIANHQLNITKVVEEGRTLTKIDELSFDNRVIEIAKMISNDQITVASTNLAKELLKA